MHLFIKGLHPHIQRQVIRTQPTSLDEAISAATAEETAVAVTKVKDTTSKVDIDALVDRITEKLGISDGKRLVAPVGRSSKDMCSQNGGEASVVCQLCATVGHNARQCSTFQRAQVPPPFEMHSQNAQYHNPPPYPYRPPGPSPYTGPQMQNYTPRYEPQYQQFNAQSPAYHPRASGPRFRDRSQVQCYRCGDFGHYKRECLGNGEGPAPMNSNQGNTVLGR